jgi:hypothetical protein
MDERRRLQATEYRRQGAACLQVAEHMSLRNDRALMLEMAKHWLKLAQTAEDEIAANTQINSSHPRSDMKRTARV